MTEPTAANGRSPPALNHIMKKVTYYAFNTVVYMYVLDTLPGFVWRKKSIFLLTGLFAWRG